MAKIEYKTVAVRMTVEIAMEIYAGASPEQMAAQALEEYMQYFRVNPAAVEVIDRPELCQALLQRKAEFHELRAQAYEKVMRDNAGHLPGDIVLQPKDVLRRIDPDQIA